MNTATPNYRPISRQAARRALEAAREDIALLLEDKQRTEQHLYALLAITTAIWEGTQDDEAPEMNLGRRAS